MFDNRTANGSRVTIENLLGGRELLSYATDTASNYKVWDEKTRRCYIRHDIIFNESDFGKPKQIVPSKPERERFAELELEITPEQSEPAEGEEETGGGDEQEIRQSQRVRRPVIRYGFDEYADISTKQVQHLAYKASEIDEPTTFEEALSGNYSKEWEAAANAEYQSLLENNTWELIKLPEGCKAIGCKWVFRVKYDSEGRVERFKGRLVAQGYSQKYGIDYDEKFSPVARYSSIRTLLAIAVEMGMQIHQMDVVTAFLNGDLKEEIYMQQPPGYTQVGKENLVCKLEKSLYGLKQAPRCWNEKLCEHLKSLNFKVSTADPCVFIRQQKELQIIAVYVDDLILLTKTSEEMQTKN